LYSLPDVVRINKARLRWAGHVEWRGTTHTKCLSVNIQAKDRSLWHREEGNIKMDLREIGDAHVCRIAVAQDRANMTGVSDKPVSLSGE